LYVDGDEVSSMPASGAIRKTANPLWIGGNAPYGEFFRGTIDEVRVYRRALRPADVRAAMSTPIGSHSGRHIASLAAAYGFDSPAGRTATDSSGHGHTGTIWGARWTSEGRFGAALRFGGAGDAVRIPAAASLNLGRAMTLMAWIKPSESQSGWRTIVDRQRDAYYLAAGGGRQDAGLFDTLDSLRFALEMLLVVVVAAAFALGQMAVFRRGHGWYWPLAVFIAASLADVAFTGSDTLIAPAALALYCAAVSARGGARIALSALAAAFVGGTVVAIAAPTALPLPPDAGGVVRAAALGLVLIPVALLSLLRKSRLAHLSEIRPP
jgi:hypothetical protein